MNTRRNAFTLVEMLVVIAIIAILIGIILPAVHMTRRTAQRTKIANEIAQLSMGVANAKSTMNARYVPSASYIWSYYDLTPPPAQPQAQYDFNQAALGDLRQFFGARFGVPDPNNPYIIRTNLPNWGSINGGQCLVFYLGGYRDGNFTTGFGDNSANPFYTRPPNGAPMVPKTFFDFATNRLWYPPTGGPPVLMDPAGVPGSLTRGTPYFYMTSQRGNDYADNYRQLNKPGLCTFPSGYYTNFVSGETVMVQYSLTMDPLVDSTGKFANPDGWQIISAGMDGMPGIGGVWRPGQGNYGSGAPGGDDLSNFKTGGLGQ